MEGHFANKSATAYLKEKAVGFLETTFHYFKDKKEQQSQSLLNLSKTPTSESTLEEKMLFVLLELDAVFGAKVITRLDVRIQTLYYFFCNKGF